MTNSPALVSAANRFLEGYAVEMTVRGLVYFARGLAVLARPIVAGHARQRRRRRRAARRAAARHALDGSLQFSLGAQLLAARLR